MDNKNIVTFQWVATDVELNAPGFKGLDYFYQFYFSKDKLLQTVIVSIF